MAIPMYFFLSLGSIFFLFLGNFFFLWKIFRWKKKLSHIQSFLISTEPAYPF
jgi:hypothetical protein